MQPLSHHSTHSHNPQQGIILKLLSVLLFGLMTLQVKLLSESYPTSQIVFSRSFFALFPLLPLIIMAGGLKALRIKSLAGQTLRNCVGLTAMILTFYSLPHVPLATFTTIQFTMPLFVVLLAALFLHEKLSGGRLAAVLAGFIGVLIVLRPEVGGYDFYALVALAAAFFVAIVTVTIRYLTATESSIAIVFWFTLFCTVTSGAYMMTEYQQPGLHDALLLIGSGLAGGAGQVLLTQAYRYGQVSLLTAFEYTGIVWAVLFELYFWDMWPDIYVLLGATIIIGAGLHLLRHATRTEKKAGINAAPIKNS